RTTHLLTRTTPTSGKDETCGRVIRGQEARKSNNPIYRAFIESIGILAMGSASRLLAPRGLAARIRAQAKLVPYYVNHHDEGEDVSALIRNRAAFLRQLGYVDEEMPLTELAMVFAASGNTV